MSDKFKEGFADIAARKLAMDRSLEDAAAVKARAEQEAQAQWQADKMSFRAHYRVITDIISDHAETLSAAGLSLRANAPSFDDRNHSGSMTVYAAAGSKSAGSSVNFSLRNSRVTPALSKEGGRASPKPVSITDADRGFYEGAILAMLEAAYPQAR